MENLANAVFAAVGEGNSETDEKVTEAAGSNDGTTEDGAGDGGPDEKPTIGPRYWWDCFAEIRKHFGLTPLEIEDLPCLYFLSMINYISTINREEMQKYQHELARLRQ